MFSSLDWGVVILYLIGMVAIGIYMSRGQKSKRDYFLGGRNLSWWMVGLSIVATETSALTFIGVPAMAIGALKIDGSGMYFTEGGSLLFMQIAIGYVIARVIVAIKMVPHYYRGDVYTPYQVLTRAFGPQPRYLSAVLSVFNMILQAGFRVYVTAIPVMIVMRTIYPSWGIWESILLFTAISILYTSIGGITAVVWTEMIQFFIFFFGGLFAMLWIPTLLHGDMAAPSGATGWGAIFEVSKEKLDLFRWGLVPLGETHTFWSWIWANITEIFGKPFNIWMGLIGATIGVMVSHGVDQLNVQRVLACKNQQGGRNALILSAVIIFPQFLIFLLVGAGLFAFYSINGFDFGGMGPWDPRTISEVTGIGDPKADYIFPIFIITHMPPVVKGFMIAGILAAAMSSLASALTAISSVAIMDLWRPLTGKSGEQKGELAMGRWGTLVVGLLLVFVAWAAKDAELIFHLVFQFAGIFSGALLGAVLFGMWTKAGYPGPVMAGMVVSSVVMLFIVIFTTTVDGFDIHWPWYSAIGTGICLGVAYLGSYAVPKPQDRSIEKATEEEI
jgi:solute:Na+ symporter, SSS family